MYVCMVLQSCRTDLELGTLHVFWPPSSPELRSEQRKLGCGTEGCLRGGGGRREELPAVTMRVLVPTEVCPRLQLTLPEEGEELRDLLQGGKGGRGRMKARYDDECQTVLDSLDMLRVYIHGDKRFTSHLNHVLKKCFK